MPPIFRYQLIGQSIANKVIVHNHLFRDRRSNNSPPGIISLGAFPYTDINLSYRIGPGLIGNRNLPYRPQVYGGHSNKIYPLIRPDRYIGDGAGAVAESFEARSRPKKKKKYNLKISKIGIEQFISATVGDKAVGEMRDGDTDVVVDTTPSADQIAKSTYASYYNRQGSHIRVIRPFCLTRYERPNIRLVRSHTHSPGPKTQNGFLETSARGVSPA